MRWEGWWRDVRGGGEMGGLVGEMGGVVVRWEGWWVRWEGGG